MEVGEETYKGSDVVISPWSQRSSSAGRTSVRDGSSAASGRPSLPMLTYLEVVIRGLGLIVGGLPI